MSHYAIFAFGIFVGAFLGFFVLSLCHKQARPINATRAIISPFRP